MSRYDYCQNSLNPGVAWESAAFRLEVANAHWKNDSGGFRLRGTEMSRIDGFSDVVFGFALTLLVVSLEVPKTYDELHLALRGFGAFAVCFAFLMSVWYSHYVFFRRYGLHDKRTIYLNSVLLFVVLFYVYPLKFLFGMLIGQLAGLENGVARFSSAQQVTELMVLYGCGFAAIYLILAMMYWNAWRQKSSLELNELERLLTRDEMIELGGAACVGLLSALVGALLPDYKAGMAGYVYFLMAPWKTWRGMHSGRIVRRLRRSAV